MQGKEIHIEEIKAILPHRYPFLLIDKILDLKKNEYAIGIKNVTINEPFFIGHFPKNAIMPGVLIIESIAQVAGVLCLKSLENKEYNSTLLVGIEETKFRGMVKPGDTLKITTNIEKKTKLATKIQGIATVKDNIVAQTKLMLCCN